MIDKLSEKELEEMIERRRTGKGRIADLTLYDFRITICNGESPRFIREQKALFVGGTEDKINFSSLAPLFYTHQVPNLPTLKLNDRCRSQDQHLLEFR